MRIVAVSRAASLLAAALVVAAVPLEGQAQEQATVVRCEELTASPAALLGFAEGYAAGRGFRFGAGARDDIRTSLARASTELQGLPSDACAQRLNEARQNLGRFINAMIAAAKSPPGPQAIIGEQTFASARASLCPLWPIC